MASGGHKLNDIVTTIIAYVSRGLYAWNGNPCFQSADQTNRKIICTLKNDMAIAVLGKQRNFKIGLIIKSWWFSSRSAFGGSRCNTWNDAYHSPWFQKSVFHSCFEFGKWWQHCIHQSQDNFIFWGYIFELTANFFSTFGTLLRLCCKVSTFQNTRKHIHQLLSHDRDFETLKSEWLDIKHGSALLWLS